jgi:hypothetical protein
MNMGETNNNTYQIYCEAEQRLDYFMAGIIGALCAFLAERYHADKLGLNTSTLALAAILMLILSFYYALKRIESIATGRRLDTVYQSNHNAVDKQGVSIKVAMDNYADNAASFYKKRNRTLVMGFLALLLSKILEAYQ